MPKLRELNLPGPKQLVRAPLVWAVIAGLCWALAFPLPGIAGLAWAAPALMLLAGVLSPERAFRTGYVAGLVQGLVSLAWLLNIPVAFAPYAGWVALSAYVALYPAAWLWLAVRLRPKEVEPTDGGTPAPHRRPPLPSPFGTPADMAGHSLLKDSGRAARTVWALQCAVAWAGLEMLRGWFLTGFPWNFLGASQYRQIPLIQIASVTGVLGVSFLVVWVSAAFFGAARLFARRPASRAWRIDLLVPGIAVIAAVVFGLAQVFSARPASRHVELALVQPSIPQRMIWDAAESTNRFRKLLELSELAVASKPAAVIWPEAAVPNLLRYEQPILAAVTNFARRHGVWMIVGADDAEPPRGNANGRGADYFNSAFLITPAGELAEKYDKQRLVIFGEYVPLARWLPFLKWLTPITGGFEPGAGATPFPLAGPGVRTCVLICFEDTFGWLARQAAGMNLDFLVNLTNNGWFGEGAAQWQHVAAAVFRAVENGMPLVRCTNNGLTCWVDRFGHIHDAGVEGGGIYGEGFRVVKIPVRAEEDRRAPTFYTRRGDWFGWMCVLLTTGLALRVRFARRAVDG